MAEYVKKRIAYVQLECKHCGKENKVQGTREMEHEQDEYGEVFIDYRCYSCKKENTRHINLENEL